MTAPESLRAYYMERAEDLGEAPIDLDRSAGHVPAWLVMEGGTDGDYQFRSVFATRARAVEYIEACSPDRVTPYGLVNLRTGDYHPVQWRPTIGGR